jgi:hypothetical protein
MAKRGKRHSKPIGERAPLIPARAKPQFNAFTIQFNGLTNRIVTPVGLTPAFNPRLYPKELPFQVIEKQALWDTGATNSILTAATVKELNLIPTGVTTVIHAGGTSQSNSYLVNFFLPNGVGVAGLIVSECENIVGDFGVIIGMDIIVKGDLAITNTNNKTWMSFRIPSTQHIDYVSEGENLEKKIVPCKNPSP